MATNTKFGSLTDGFWVRSVCGADDANLKIENTDGGVNSAGGIYFVRQGDPRGAITCDYFTGISFWMKDGAGGFTRHFVIDDAGNVGIGTGTSPATKLHVIGNGQVVRIGGTDHAYIAWYPDGTSTRKAYTGFAGAADDQFSIVNEIATTGDIYITNGSGAKVRFTAIGTTASAANAFLDSGNNNSLLRSTSSRRYKKNIKDSGLDTSRIYNLRPVEFDDKTLGTHHIGLVAEEVAEQIPELVHWTPEKSIDPESTNNTLVPDSVQYPLIGVFLISEMKKLKDQVDAQQKTISVLLNRLEALEKTQSKDP